MKSELFNVKHRARPMAAEHARIIGEISALLSGRQKMKAEEIIKAIEAPKNVVYQLLCYRFDVFQRRGLGYYSLRKART